MKTWKKIVLAACGFVLAVAAVATGALILDSIKGGRIFNDFSTIYAAEKYKEPVRIEGVHLIKQEVSCGYAVIEMLAGWMGESVTEESLLNEYGKVVTATGKQFEAEMNKRFPAYKTTMYPYLSNTEMIEKIYGSLKKGIPVPFQWAAKFGDEWTLHYSLITGLDIGNDSITVLNPYGYEEHLDLASFFERTSFRAYSNMPLFLRLAFAFGLFERNTIFMMERIPAF